MEGAWPGQGAGLAAWPPEKAGLGEGTRQVAAGRASEEAQPGERGEAEEGTRGEKLARAPYSAEEVKLMG